MGGIVVTPARKTGGAAGLTTANNGLSVSGGNTAQLGGNLIKDTTISFNGFNFILSAFGLFVINGMTPGAQTFENGDNYDLTLDGNIVATTFNYRTSLNSNPGTGVGPLVGDFNEFALVNITQSSESHVNLWVVTSNITTLIEHHYAYAIPMGQLVNTQATGNWLEIPPSWTADPPANQVTFALQVKFIGGNLRFRMINKIGDTDLNNLGLYMQVDPQSNIEKTNGNNGVQGNDPTINIPVFTQGSLTTSNDNLYDSKGNIFLKQLAFLNIHLFSTVGITDFVLYTVPAGFNQLLRVNPSLFISSLGISTVNLDLVYTDESGVVTTQHLATYTSLTTITLQSQVIYAQNLSNVILRVDINVPGAQVNLYATIEYLGVEN